MSRKYENRHNLNSHAFQVECRPKQRGFQNELKMSAYVYLYKVLTHLISQDLFRIKTYRRWTPEEIKNNKFLRNPLTGGAGRKSPRSAWEILQ